MNRWLKRLAYAVAGLVGVLLVTAAGVYGLSETRLRKQYTVAAPSLTIPTDSASVARGSHLARAIAGCVDCHGEKLEGKLLIDAPPLGRISGLNLTSGKGGIGGTLSDADFVRAIRHGVGPDGRALKLMPSDSYANISDSDLAAIIAYLKSLPPVDNVLPAQTLGPVGRALLVAGKLPILHTEQTDHAKSPPESVPVATTADYGAYLVSMGCKGCHGPALAGGPVATGDPDWPPASNLTPAGSLKDWSVDDFRRLLREGTRPGGVPVNVAMPWRSYRNMTDDEIQAIWLYLKTLPAVATPGIPAATN